MRAAAERRRRERLEAEEEGLLDVMDVGYSEEESDEDSDGEEGGVVAFDWSASLPPFFAAASRSRCLHPPPHPSPSPPLRDVKLASCSQPTNRSPPDAENPPPGYGVAPPHQTD